MERVLFHWKRGYFINLLQIGSKWVLTAAHCIYDDFEPYEPDDLFVLIGFTQKVIDDTKDARLDLINYANNAVTFHYSILRVRRVKKVIIHPDYNSDTTENDIAVLKLRKFLSFYLLLSFQGETAFHLGSTPLSAYLSKARAGLEERMQL